MLMCYLSCKQIQIMFRHRGQSARHLWYLFFCNMKIHLVSVEWSGDRVPLANTMKGKGIKGYVLGREGLHFLETTWNVFHLENRFLSCGNWQWSVRDSIHALLSFVGANTTNYNCKGKWNKWNVMAVHCSYLSDIIWLCSFIIVIKQVFLPTSLCRHWNKQECIQRSALTAVHLMSIRFTNHSDGDWIICMALFR